MKGKLTLYLILKNSLIIQVDKGRNYYPTSLSFISLLSFSKNHEKYFLGPHFFTQKPP